MLVYNYIILDLSPIFSFYTILQPPWVVCIIVWLAFWYMISTPCFPSKPLQATSDTVRSIAWGVCTTHICDHQILKTSLVSTRPLDSPWCTGCHLMILNGKFNGRKVVFFFYCWSPQFYGRYDAGTRQPLSDEFWFGSHWWSDDSRLIGLDVFTYIALIWKLSIPKERLQHSICCC